MSTPEQDRLDVAAQLGRPPRGSWSVARRCGCGKPQVIQTQPRLDDGTPFPTMWWLTCRKLSSRIGGLESSGWMAELNERLRQDLEFHEELSRATQRYVRRRDEIDPLGATGHPGGGPDHIKCLHAHVAHQLVSGDNPAGARALEHLDWADPATPCV